MNADVAVVGAGPGGLAAATAAARAGAHVVLIDGYANAGGQYSKQRFDAARPRAGSYDTRVYAVSRRDRALPFRLYATRAGRPLTIDARALVLAPGAYERALPFPGWDLPGVMTPGAAQTLVKAHGVRPGNRVAIAGSGPFLLPVAIALLEASARIVGIYEAASLPALWRMPAALAQMPERALQAGCYARTLRDAGVPVHFGRAVTSAHGEERLETIRIARVDRLWRPRAGGEYDVAVDVLCTGFGFLAQTDLADQLQCKRYEDGGAFFVACGERAQTSVPGAYAAGEISGIRGAEAALAQGEIAGIGAAAYCGKLTRAQAAFAAREPARRFAKHAAFAGALARSYSVRRGWTAWLRDDTLVCRCEEVPAGAIRDAVTSGARDLRAVKALTRCGMGLCQGRMCAYAAAQITAELTGSTPAAVGTFTRTGLAIPVPLNHLAHASTGSA
ncbi:MAG TPA: FAD-dependent oxidoreductase [Candidatus Baltobacteraceae bacterium]